MGGCWPLDEDVLGEVKMLFRSCPGPKAVVSYSHGHGRRGMLFFD